MSPYSNKMMFFFVVMWTFHYHLQYMSDQFISSYTCCLFRPLVDLLLNYVIKHSSFFPKEEGELIQPLTRVSSSILQSSNLIFIIIHHSMATKLNFVSFRRLIHGPPLKHDDLKAQQHHMPLFSTSIREEITYQNSSKTLQFVSLQH